MEIEKIQEMSDGSALFTLIVSDEEQRMLIEEGFVSLLKKMIRKEKHNRNRKKEHSK